MLLKTIISKGIIKSAQDISDGGLFLALLESGLTNNLGCAIQSEKSIRKDAFLFGEAQGRVVVSCNADNKTALENTLSQLHVPFSNLGAVKGTSIEIDGTNYGSIKEFENLYLTSIEKRMN